ncbi:putative GATA type transcriptional activator [Lentinula aciculospora]|uniref:GATA type transcriptional activator n=1 Tax=Lentinula aciculospora TaxID=153920 RepID=A0A9W9DNX1_9AGAR|nr:putative GATA type transcriptional activator [Lentinula aciculospora]
MLSDMDALSFDGYTSYSDSSAPRTPSPRADITYTSPTQIYDDEANAGASSGYRGSLLQELYGQDEAYSKQQQQQQQQQQHSQLPPSSSHPTMPRRATFPYVRHDVPSYPTSSYDVYEEAYVVPSNGPSGPTAYYQPPHNPYLQQHQQSSPHHHPYGPPSSGMLPAPNMMGGMPGMPMGPYGHLQPPLPIQHTDDAASKETQYLRRRCFNCHTTEPPSWRRSTLNPGKIVCNKCGLYERTHLRPRPLRFDELRAGGKSRKNSLSNGSSGGNGKTSPKSPGKSLVKKEIIDVGLGRVRGNRRSSVSSSAGSGSDWDDNAQPTQLYPTQPEVQYSYDSPSYVPTSGYATSSPPTDSPTFGPPAELYGSPYSHHGGSPYHHSGSPYYHSNSSASPPDTTRPDLTLPPIILEEVTPTKRASN